MIPYGLRARGFKFASGFFGLALALFFDLLCSDFLKYTSLCKAIEKDTCPGAGERGVVYIFVMHYLCMYFRG
jgi:hypothetical protein